MKTKLFLICIIFLCTGCSLFQKKPQNKPEFNTLKDIRNTQKVINKSANTIDKGVSDIIKETNKIDTEASNIKNKIPSELKYSITPHLNKITESSDSIKKDTLKINKATANLSSAISLLENAEEKIIITEDSLDKIAKERDEAIVARKEAEEARDSTLHKTIRWLILGSIVAAAGLGVFGFMYGSKLSLTLSGTCIIIMSIAIFVETYFFVVIIFGAIVLIGLIGALVWNIIVQKKAFSQIVDTVEVAKSNLPLDIKAELFGDDGQTGIMDSIQSPETIKMVSKEKKKMLLWNSMKKE